MQGLNHSLKGLDLIHVLECLNHAQEALNHAQEDLKHAQEALNHALEGLNHAQEVLSTWGTKFDQTEGCLKMTFCQHNFNDFVIVSDIGSPETQKWSKFRFLL